jgi:hypothetical protein
VSILQKKIKRLIQSRHACSAAGLGDNFEDAVQSAQGFATRCLNFGKSSGDSDQATQGLRSHYKEVTSKLLTLAISANSAGINLQAEARDIFETINDLMDAVGFVPGERSSGEPS